jgi:hypothetical protein
MGESYWRLGVALVGLLMLVGALVDTWLYATGRQTISAWLRENPGWFWYPAGLAIIFLVHFALHLFVGR